MWKFRLSQQSRSVLLTALAICIGCTLSVQAKNPIKSSFLDVYPDADGTVLTDLPSNAGHCGLCHYNFDGGGNRNPYGAAIEAERAANGKDSVAAILTIRWLDSDGDGFPNETEITDNMTSYDNTPTFPGLTVANIGGVSLVDIEDIEDHLTPSSGIDDTDPSVTLYTPNGGETATGNAPTTISWNANDASGIAGIDIYVSHDSGANYTPIALGLPNTPNTFTWYVSNRDTTTAMIKVEAIDNAGNEGEDESDAVFTIVNPAGGLVPTTLRDFDLSGSQPLVDSGLPQEQPSNCANCHGGYNEEHEPYHTWMGSMMAQAALDMIFLANMTIANQDAPDSGDLCLRCHNSRGWLDGRSTPTDGSQMTELDMAGVSCDLCHRMVDPIYQPGISPAADEDIINHLEKVPTHQGNGMFVFDPKAHRRGPFDDTVSQHTALHSPFHQDAALCGTCHDVSNPVFIRDGTNTEYVANAFDTPPDTDSTEILMPVERTYSEWFYSAYNSSNGVFAPQFAGNKAGGMVATCQDCHMSDILGYGANPNLPDLIVPERADLPWHDLTGGSTWLPNLLPDVFGLGDEERAALSNGVWRAEYLLRHAARMKAEKIDDELRVTVINETGHKLPSGYPEGRRMWINVRFYDENDTLLEELGGYDYGTGVLTNDNTTVYEIHPGIGPNLADTLNTLNPGLGIESGPSLHFVLNNQVFEDNRIPPRGFTNTEYEKFGGAPVGHHYDDGQYWDESYFALPEGAVRADVQLYYQSTSKEFMEFLRDENHTDETGNDIYNLWNNNGKCPPTLMTEAVWPENFWINSIGWTVAEELGIAFNSISGYTYWVEYTDELGASNLFWQPFISNGFLEASGSNSLFMDDFTPNTSGSESPLGQRFYRIQR